MITSAPGWWLSVAITAVLLLASAIGAAMKHQVAHGLPHPGIDNLRARVRSWWVMAALLGAVFWAGAVISTVFFAVIAVMALREYVAATPAPRARTWLAGFFICVVCIGFIPALLWLDLPGDGARKVLLAVFLILVAQASDVLQYVWGKLFGKRLIAPGISPSKTVAGYVGGTLSASAVGAAVWWITPFTPLQAALISLLITQLGFVGGLILSAQKRARGIKDWGDLIHGHGGILDRLDSLWLPAPVFYALLKWGWAG